MEREREPSQGSWVLEGEGSTGPLFADSTLFQASDMESGGLYCRCSAESLEVSRNAPLVSAPSSGSLPSLEAAGVLIHLQGEVMWPVHFQIFRGAQQSPIPNPSDETGPDRRPRGAREGAPFDQRAVVVIAHVASTTHPR